MAKSVLDDRIEAAKEVLKTLEDAKREERAAKRKAYMEQERVKTEQFRDRLFAEHGVEKNPKREACFALAWEFGHAYGYSEVEHYFAQLVTLIQ